MKFFPHNISFPFVYVLGGNVSSTKQWCCTKQPPHQRCCKTTKEMNTTRRELCKEVPGGRKWISEWMEFYTNTNTHLSFLIIRKLLFFSSYLSHLFLLHATPGATVLLPFWSSPDLKIKPGFKEHEEKKPQSSSSPGQWQVQIHRVSDGPPLPENSFKAAPHCLLGSELSLILRYKHFRISFFFF